MRRERVLSVRFYLPAAREGGNESSWEESRANSCDEAKQIADAGSRFWLLAKPWGDTGTSTARLMLAVLGGLPDAERDFVRARKAGIRLIKHAQREAEPSIG